jgi:hypothetical protein
MIPDNATERKILSAIIALFSLRCTALGAILGAFLVLALAIFATLLGALIEVCTDISQLYTTCSPIERVLVLVLAYCVLVKLAPIVLRVASWQKISK